MRGALFENWVFGEIAKNLLNRGEPAQFYFWRTQGGQEMDFVVESGNTVQAIEAKSGMTVKPDAASTIERTVEHWRGTPVRASVVYGGERTANVRECRILPWKCIGRLFKEEASR